MFENNNRARKVSANLKQQMKTKSNDKGGIQFLLESSNYL